MEHATAKQLIAELEDMQAGDDLYDAKFTVLGEYVNHHIKEEQNEIFPLAKKAKVDLEKLGEELLRRKKELQGSESDAETASESHSRQSRPERTRQRH